MRNWLTLILLCCFFQIQAQPSGDNANFSNEAERPLAPPANDDPCNATPLTIGASCNFTSHTSAEATATAGVADPACSGYLGADVWFRVTVPAGGILIFDTNTGVLTDAGMAIYSGTCNALVPISCDDDASANGFMPKITATNLTPGSTIWIRIWGFGGTTGTFQICVSTPPPPNEQDCPAAIAICQNVYDQLVSYTGTGNIPNEINPAISCLGSGETADVWYTFTVQTSGNLHFLITPHNPAEDYDWEVYNITNATCSDIYTNPALSVSCNFSGTPGVTGPTGGSTFTSQGPSGSPFNALVPVQAGETYMINVSNYTQSTNGYIINLGASTAVMFDNAPPKPLNVTADCGNATITLNLTENVLCNTLQTSDFSVTGPAGNYTVTGWSSTACTSGAPFTKTITLTLSPVPSSGNYNICINANAVTDLCSNSGPQSCIPFTVGGTEPLFAAIPPFCAGTTPPVLPTTSTNGITGTWSPSTVSNTATGNYTFTPSSGQCNAPKTITITVNERTTPVFNLPSTVCTGSTPPALPNTSQNGITGTWLPAVVSSTTSGSYTFTPSAGACATSYTHAITVSGSITPQFSTPAPLCSGSTAPVLPTTSNNGITGTWNPTVVSNTTTGTYTFTPAPGQCATSATLTVTVNPQVTPVFNTVAPFCAGATAPVLPVISLNGIQGTWSPAVVSNTTSGTYTFTPINSACATQAVINIVVTQPVTPQFQQIPPFCTGGVAPVLPGVSQEGIAGTWSPAIVSNTAGGTYTFTPSAGQCAVSTTLSIDVVAIPSAPAVTSPVTLCQFGPAAPLTASGTFPLIWYSVPTGTGTSVAPVPGVSNTGTFNYYVSQANGNCESPYSTIVVNVLAAPVTGEDTVLKICSGDSANLYLLYDTTGIQYSWTFNAQPADPVRASVSGIYRFIITDAQGCSDTADVDLQILPLVVANAGADGFAEAGIPYQLSGSGGTEYTWSPGPPLLNDAGIANPLATISNATEFTLEVKDEAGCSDSDKVLIRVLNGPGFYVPNAFTPNGDNLNDVFRPAAVGITKLKYFRVFNRYGEVVFETNEIGKGWDGTYKGKKQNIGAYAWMIKGIDRLGEEVSMKGWVVLVR